MKIKRPFQKVLSPIIGVSALFLLLTSAVIASPFVEKDFLASGDTLLTLDTITGLEWLDVTLTAGQDYDVVESSSTYVLNDGFRFATQAEVQAMMTAFGISPLNGVFNAANLAPVTEALDLMGNLLGDTFHQAMYDQGPTMGLTIIQVDGSGTLAKGNLSQGTGLAKSHDFNGYLGLGSYLVREAAIPAPPALYLLIIGLAVLGSFKCTHRVTG